MRSSVGGKTLVAMATLSLPVALVGTFATATPAGATPTSGKQQPGRSSPGWSHGGAPHGGADTLRVGCGHNAYETIDAAVTAATSGDTILVCPGTYDEHVVVPSDKTLTIKGLGHPVVDAADAGPFPGIQVLSSGSTIEHLTVENAVGEGILVGALPGNPGTTVSDVTIRRNIVVNNDQGNPTGGAITDSPYAQCNAVQGIPGDCGEGIHLLTTSGSVVSGNFVSGNSGGVLLTDENGPTYENVVSGNVIANNVLDCGVTMASHNPAGGLHDNQILKNLITGNGTEGEGGGVLIASPLPGGAVFDNLIAGNHISGNGLAGVTVHSHTPGQNLNGNTIEGNLIGTNNLAPDHDYAAYGYVDEATTGVIVATLSNVAITIQHNVIAKNEIGVWLAGINGATISASGLQANVFAQVTTPVVNAVPTP